MKTINKPRGHNMILKRGRLIVLPALITILALISTLGLMQAHAENLTQVPRQKSKRPNFLLIVADDMGYSDLGSYGGEINTPVLDQLAQQGMRYTDFYVSPTCSVTRAMLLSGTDNHVAGLGSMAELLAPNQVGKPGYEGVLNKRVTSVAELLRDNGYHTYMAGKWHLGLKPDQIPHARGFERDFSTLVGGGSHFNDGWNVEWQIPKMPYTEDGLPVKELPKDFYSTKTYTDKTIQFIKEGRQDGKPFFAYMAYTAPHGPLHLPDDWLRRYKNRYDEGWDGIRQQRLERMQKLGIIDKGDNAADRLYFVPRSTALAPALRVMLGRKMELYAGMVEYMDDQIGRVFDYLKEIGEYDNTIVIFISDNGAEGNDLRGMIAGKVGSLGFLHAMNNFAENGHNSLGRKGTYAEYGPAWAQVSMAPFRIYKGWVSEGGIRSPLIVSGPGVKGAGKLNKKAVLHTMDIAPTILELAGIEHSPVYKGHKIAPMQGKSWVGMLDGSTQSPRTSDDWLGWELFNNRAIRQGDWKISWLYQPFGTEDWQLFNLAEDLGEQYDLSDKFPEKKKALIALWDEYVKTNGVIIGKRSPFEGARKALPDSASEFDNYPPIRGMEAMPYKKLKELLGK
ncbi:MAG: sulfatase-like hydrolase/transferase [Methylococcaceae bacterium]|nr:sulfatase-like hydrolase/transferase [Methylococcaceae bacterium]